MRVWGMSNGGRWWCASLKSLVLSGGRGDDKINDALTSERRGGGGDSATREQWPEQAT
jgi:hypothetical protein